MIPINFREPASFSGIVHCLVTWPVYFYKGAQNKSNCEKIKNIQGVPKSVPKSAPKSVLLLDLNKSENI